MAKMIYSDLFHEVQIQQDKELGTTSVLIDGKPVKYVRSIEFEQSALEVPTVILEINALPEIDTDALVEFNFSPKSYADAARLLIAGAKADSTIRNGIMSSIVSAINDLHDEFMKRRRYEIADVITKRLLNED